MGGRAIPSLTGRVQARVSHQSDWARQEPAETHTADTEPPPL
jgi:hypothetical protein